MRVLLIEDETPLRTAIRARRPGRSGNVPARSSWHCSNLLLKGLRYRVQRSLDLQTWADVPGDITATADTATTTLIEALGLGEVFYRAKEVNP